MTLKLRLIPALLVACVISLGAYPRCFAQNPSVRVGILSIDDKQPWFKPFEATLAKRGWIAGKNVVLEYRNAGGDAARFKDAAKELVRANVKVIYSVSAPAVHAARAATRTIPIVGMDYTTDAIAAGYANSYARPGQNLTGVFLDAPEFTGKWLEILRAVVPDLSRVAVLWDPAPGSAHLAAIRNAARASGIQLQVLEVRAAEDLERAFAKLQPRPQAVVVLPSPMLYFYSARLAQLTIERRLPATSMFRLFSDSGGVLSYGPDLSESVERCAAIVTKILGGDTPAELPLERPTKFELIVNLKTAKALGITIPEEVLLRADALLR